LEPNKVSVVIVSFNRVEHLRESLAALRESGAGLQVIVVDNGSRDGAASLDDEFPDVRFSRLPRNFGLTRALNIGIRAADGDYVLLMHDDVRIDGLAVLELAAFLENRADVGAVCPKIDGPQVRPLPTPSDPDPALRNAPDGDEFVAECVLGAAIMVRATFLRSMGHIDERYGNYGSDIELCARVRSSNRKLVVLGSVTASHGSAPSPMPKGTLKGDRAAGTIVFIAKQFGFGAGLLCRLKMAALGGAKIDGSG
jgi:GT2 family glycosyltransferase